VVGLLSQDVGPETKSSALFFGAKERRREKSVDGRHKAGHDDHGTGRLKPTIHVAGCRRSDPLIVMAGLVPAIHVLFFLSRNLHRIVRHNLGEGDDDGNRSR
jgi:hypothetical protein